MVPQTRLYRRRDGLMSMTYGMYPVSAPSLELLRSESKWMDPFLSPPPDPPQPPGLFSRLFGGSHAAAEKRLAEKIERMPACLKEDKEREACEIDVHWQALHFLLSGDGSESPWPEGFLLHGGTLETIEPPAGCDNTWTYTPVEVKQIHLFLHAVDEECLRTRFNPEAMDELSIYPFDWTEQSEEKLNRLLTCFLVLKAFIEVVSKQRLGVVCQLG